MTDQPKQPTEPTPDPRPALSELLKRVEGCLDRLDKILDRPTTYKQGGPRG